MKKIVLILLLVLFGCSNSQEDTNANYIKPVKEEVLFNFLNEDTKNLLKEVNNGLDVENVALKNLGKSLPDFILETIDGESLNLSDYINSKLVIEVVSIYCSHCKNQALNENPYIVSKYPELTFITYFVNGNKDSANSFYKEIGISEHSDNEIITLENDTFNDFLSKEYGFNATPAYYFFNAGKLTWCNIGTIEKNDFDSLYNFAFNQEFDTALLVSEDGQSIFDFSRDSEDVKNDLDQDKFAKLQSLDNDDNTVYLTLNHIGQVFDFANQYSDDSNFKSEIDFNVDYSKDELVFIMISGDDDNLINLINSFYDDNKDIKVFVINTSDQDNEEIAAKLKAPLASIMNQVPKFLDSGSLGNYPSALFVQDGYITGIYSNILGIDELNRAKELFLGKDSIALN